MDKDQPPDALTESARETLKECKFHWDAFRKESANTLELYIDQNVDYFQNVLDDKSSPRDWVKGGLALCVQGLSTTRSLWSSAYRLLCSPTKGGS
jgi:hypothetical protein